MVVSMMLAMVVKVTVVPMVVDAATVALAIVIV